MMSITARFLRGLAAVALVLAVAGCGTPSPIALQVEPYQPNTDRVGAWYNALRPGTVGAPVAIASPSPAAPVALPGVQRPINPVRPAAPPMQPAPGQVAPASAPQPETLRALKKGDKITVYLLGVPDPQQIEDVIDDLGNVSLPHLNDVKLEGLSTSQAERMIRDRYIKDEIYPSINVTIVSQNDEFFVRGEVKREGRYPLTGGLTLMRGISVAGGYTEYAQPKKVRVMRTGQILVFNMNDVYEGKLADPMVRRGDIIVVPRRWLF